MQSLEIQGYSYAERSGLLFSLTTELEQCGGWLLEHRLLSPTTIELRLEIELRSIVDLYAALIAAGLEFTRSGHLALTAACTCRRNQSAFVELRRIIVICLEIDFLEDTTLRALQLAHGPVA